jgi:hypothetical protein
MLLDGAVGVLPIAVIVVAISVAAQLFFAERPDLKKV